MSKLLKYVLITLAALLVLVGVVLGAVVLLFDPNDYRDNITAAVQRATGRELTIVGNIELSVFPWLGVSLGETRLGNAKGFGDAPFAAVRNADIKVRLLPLLRKRVEMKTLQLHGLRVSLARHLNGVTNWDDLMAALSAPDAAAEQPADRPPAALAALAIGGVEILDAQLEWDDRQTGRHVVLDQLSLTTGPIDLVQPMDFRLASDVVLNATESRSHVDLAGRLTLDLPGQRYQIEGLKLAVKASGQGLPVSPLEAVLRGSVVADLAQQTLALNNIELTVQDLVLQGQAQVSQLQSAPVAQGKLSVAPFSLRQLLAGLDVEAPPTADAAALNQAALSLEFSASPQALRLNRLALQLDDSELTGSVVLTDFQQPKFVFDLHLTDIDLDRYLPPGTQAPPATPASAATGAVQLPLGMLRRLHGEGKFKADKLKIAQARLSDIVLGFKAEGGQLRLHPLQARLYQGGYSGNIGLDVRSSIPLLSLEEKLTGISLGPLLQDVMGEDLLSGTGNMQVTLTAQGTDPALIKQTLNGSASLSLRDGAVQGVNLGQMIREAYAKVKGLPPPAATSNQTDFAELSASVTIKNGLVSNNDLLVKTPLLRIGGKGLIDLPEERIDYLVSASIVGSVEGQGGKELAELKSLTIPVKVTGSFEQPKFGLDLKQVMKGVATMSVKKKVEEQEKEGAQKLEQKLKENLKKLF